ncbi:MAG TPA: serine/threonine-protein kinase [Polyangiaceae bacterium]|nr:serine/threonine-protein kinase [Polyangiaceae bacterium]
MKRLSTASRSSLSIPIFVDLPCDTLERPSDPDIEVRESCVLDPGELIAGKYRVERELAVGGMGIVYSCTDLILDRAVAVKVIHPTIVDGESVKERFYFEARTLARLNNPHITRIYECGFTESDEPYMVMELLKGIDLFELVRKEGTLSPARVARFALQICRGLRDAHAVGIVHRDLKPENLFLTHGKSGAELIKIIDFGISKQHCLRKSRSLTNPSMSLGSPHYMAPEQIRTPSDVDARADIWSLGVVMYELLSGQSPFDGPSWREVCTAVLTGHAAPLRPRIPEALQAIVMRCLERNQSARFANVDELAHALRAFLSGKRRSNDSNSSRSPVPVTVTVQPTTSRARTPTRRRLRALGNWAAALAALVMVVTLGIRLSSQRDLLAKLASLPGVSVLGVGAAPAAIGLPGARAVRPAAATASSAELESEILAAAALMQVPIASAAPEEPAPPAPSAAAPAAASKVRRVRRHREAPAPVTVTDSGDAGTPAAVGDPLEPEAKMGGNATPQPSD